MPVPDIRLRKLNDAPVRANRSFVLYWMVAFRRTAWNFSLDRAVQWAQQLGKPLVILEPLRCDYPWASERHHQFVIDGMRDNAAALAPHPVTYYPYLEQNKGEGKGLLTALAQHACAVVTDDYPAFFIPHLIAAAASKLDVMLEAVDSNGLLPLRATDRVFTTAFSFRRFLQQELGSHLQHLPLPNPFHRAELPRLKAADKDLAKVQKRWAPANLLRVDLETFPFADRVPVSAVNGGAKEGLRRLKHFIKDVLPRYHQDRNHPDLDGQSGLSPYLHFGHLSAHEVFNRVFKTSGGILDNLNRKAAGKRQGFWRLPEPVESFLDELVTWREVGYNMAHKLPDEYQHFESLPGWAKQTLNKHRTDPRAQLYSLPELESSETADDVWNAAQRQLVREGRIHNYLRMLWGKKVLEWSPSPEEALERLIHLNNKYALDGRDPNSYSGIFWVLGRYDRAWGPERAVYGTVRYMSSANTQRKIQMRRYLGEFGPNAKDTLRVHR